MEIMKSERWHIVRMVRMVVYESESVTGTINLTPPSVFGTPQPSDGILGLGEDIKVRYNEAVQTGAFTNINVRGLQNQQAINHNVSIALDGSDNNIVLPKVNLSNQSFCFAILDAQPNDRIRNLIVSRWRGKSYSKWK